MKRVGNNPLWISKMDAHEKRATASGLNPLGGKIEIVAQSRWNLVAGGKALRRHVSWNIVVWGKY
jgi:hypothetical protein